MQKLKVTMEIELRRTAIQEALEDDELTEEEILNGIEDHILEAVGNRGHDGWHYILDCFVSSIGVS